MGTKETCQAFWFLLRTNFSPLVMRGTKAWREERRSFKGATWEDNATNPGGLKGNT